MTFQTLVSAEELAAHVEDASWGIFDCRHDLARPEAGAQAYRLAHIPSAQFLHLDRDLSGPTTGRNGRHPLPDAAALAATFAQRGVSNESQVIAYDDSGGMVAARLWWLLRWLGHDKVALLDGGLAAWRRAGYSLTDRVSTVRSISFKWRLSEEAVDAAYLQAHMRQPGLLLIDARALDRFRGENETLDPVAGHIPGAVNRPFRNNLAADGRFKPAAQLHGEFDELLQRYPVESIVSYCGSGVSACHHLLALEIAGLHGARLYPGSWSEWSSDPRRPMATGAS
jgi:thiosulfate/3-mercaptopyruvate sulfurtransferase